MTTSEFHQHFSEAFGPDLGSGRLTHLTRSLQACGVLPRYSQRFTLFHAALFTIAAISFERVHDRDAVRDQANEVFRMASTGDHIITSLIDLLTDPDRRSALAYAAIDCNFGPACHGYVIYSDGTHSEFGQVDTGITTRTVLRPEFFEQVAGWFAAEKSKVNRTPFDVKSIA